MLSLLLLVPVVSTSDERTIFGVVVALQPLLIFVMGGLTTWGLWSVKRAAPTREEHAALARDVDGIGKKVDQFEKSCAEMPSHKDLGTIHVQLERLLGRMDTTNAELRGFKDTTRRTEDLVNTMHQHLLNEKMGA